MTKKILLPLLAAPLLLASCSGGNAKPAPFEQGDSLLSAELYSALFATEDDTLSLEVKSLVKETVDKEANPVWTRNDAYDMYLPYCNFMVFEKSVTVDGVTTTTYEAYNKATLELVVTWEENNNPERVEDVEASFYPAINVATSAMIPGLSTVEIIKTVYKDKTRVEEDHQERVLYDNFGHKIDEYDGEHQSSVMFMVQPATEAAPQATMLHINKWSKDHYESSLAQYAQGFSKLVGIKEADVHPSGYYTPGTSEVEKDGVKYTFVESLDSLKVYKEGEEKPITDIDYSLLDNYRYAFFEENLVYYRDLEVEDSSSDFTYVEHTSQGNQVKHRQEIYSVNFFTGEETKLENKYAIERLSYLAPIDEETEVGYISVSKIREDKTLEPASSRMYIVDSDLVLHDDITYSPFVNMLADRYQYWQVGSHYIVRKGAEKAYELYDENLKYVGEFDKSLRGLTVYGNKVAFENLLGQTALFDEEGKMVLPFASFEIEDATKEKALVSDSANNTYGILDFASCKIEWLDDAVTSSDYFVYLEHNVAPEGEPEELNYVTYYAGQKLGDFEYKLSAKVFGSDYGVLSDDNIYLVSYFVTLNEVVAEDTSVTQTYTAYLAK